MVHRGTCSIAHAQDLRFPAKAVRERAPAVQRKRGKRSGGSRDPQTIIRGDCDEPGVEWSETSDDRTEPGKPAVRTQTRSGRYCSIKLAPIDTRMRPLGSRVCQAIAGGKSAATPEAMLLRPIICTDNVEETISRKKGERLEPIELAPALRDNDHSDAGEPGFPRDRNGVQTFVAIDQPLEQGDKLT